MQPHWSETIPKGVLLGWAVVFALSLLLFAASSLVRGEPDIVLMPAFALELALPTLVVGGGLGAVIGAVLGVRSRMSRHKV